MNRPRHRGAKVLLLASLGACADAAGPVDDSLGRLTIVNPGPVAVRQNASLQLLAYDRSGRRVPPPSVTWESNDASIMSVDSSGMVTGNSLGQAMVSAKRGSVRGVMGIEVTAAAVRISIEPGRPSMAVGETAVLTGALLDFTGGIIPGAYSFYWEFWPETTLIFSRKPGLTASQIEVTAVDTGMTGILAIQGSARGYASVRVVALPTATRSSPSGLPRARP